MSLIGPNPVSIAQHSQNGAAQARTSPSVHFTRPKFLGSKLPHQPTASSKAVNKAGVSLIGCQPSPYSLHPSIASLQYQPAELPEASVKTCDFLVLGSGIAGLTYALKVCHGTCICATCSLVL